MTHAAQAQPQTPDQAVKQAPKQPSCLNRFFGGFSKKPATQLIRFFPSAHPWLWILLIALCVNVLLVASKLMPGFADINPFDEAKYVESGWLLLRGEIRSLAWGPLVALFYAPAHWVVGNSPDWFMLEAWVGRFLLFICLWLSLVYLAYQLKEHASPFITVGLLFVTIPLFPIIENQSDAVFVSLSVLSLANLVAYARAHLLRNTVYASIFVGLGAMARVETVVLIGTLAVLALIIGWRRQPALKILAACVLPALGLLSCLLLVNLVHSGDLNLGVGNKSYESFEMNQSILTGGDVEKARQDAQRLFGTQAQNHGSVVRAILRNPGAFWLRIVANAKGIPWSFFYFFGKTQGFVLLLFSVWGLYTLIRKRAYTLVMILLIWPLHAAIPLGFLAKHVIPQTYYLPMLLGAIGIAAAFSKEALPFERGILFAGSALVGLFSWVDHKPAFLFGMILVTAILAIAWLLRVAGQASGNANLTPVMLLLLAGLILRGPYSFLGYSPLGKSGEEQAVYSMEKSLPLRTKILVPFPLPAVAAKMVDVTMSDVPKNIKTAGDLWQWLKDKNIGAAYVDDRYPVSPSIAALLEAGSGTYFKHGYESEDKKVRIYLVKEKADNPGAFDPTGSEHTQPAGLPDRPPDGANAECSDRWAAVGQRGAGVKGSATIIKG